MPLEALVFDVDGTLADTERDGHRIAFNRAFGRVGLDWVWDVPLYGVLLAVTGGKERIRHYSERYHKGPIDNALVQELHRLKTREYAALIEEEGIPLRPGVQRLLTEARSAGVKLAIATTTTPDNVRALLGRALGPSWSEWFAAIGAGDIVPAKKPAPDIYHHVLKVLGLPPDSCVAFEDSENGLASALGAGLATVVTVNDYTRTQSFKGAALVLSDLGEPGHACRVFAGGREDQRIDQITLSVLSRICDLKRRATRA
ncbi:MAG: HAD family hydrolase [Acidiferrobacteraceae bacterium]